MRRVFAILLTVMLALALFASTARAMPHGDATHHAIDDSASETMMHVAVPVEAASSCCAGEVQHAGPSCAVFLAVLPADPSVPRPALRPLGFVAATRAGDGVDPERLLDPPRS